MLLLLRTSYNYFALDKNTNFHILLWNVHGEILKNRNFLTKHRVQFYVKDEWNVLADSLNFVSWSALEQKLGFFHYGNDTDFFNRCNYINPGFDKSKGYCIVIGHLFIIKTHLVFFYLYQDLLSCTDVFFCYETDHKTLRKIILWMPLPFHSIK